MRGVLRGGSESLGQYAHHAGIHAAGANQPARAIHHNIQALFLQRRHSRKTLGAGRGINREQAQLPRFHHRRPAGSF